MHGRGLPEAAFSERLAPVLALIKAIASMLSPSHYLRSGPRPDMMPCADPRARTRGLDRAEGTTRDARRSNVITDRFSEVTIRRATKTD